MKTIRRINSIIVLLALLMSLAISSTASASTYVYTSGKANMRSGAGLDYSIRRTVEADTKMEKLGTSRDDRNVLWYKVKVNNRTGWVSSLYVTTTYGGSSTKGKVKLTGSEYIRYRPSKYASKLGTVSKGTTVSYYDTSVDDRGVTWYLVHINDITGWISSANTQKGSGKTTYITADGGKSHIRKGPGLDYKTIDTLPSNGKAEYAGSTKYDDRGVAWYKINYNGTIGWVSSRYTKKTYK